MTTWYHVLGTLLVVLALRSYVLAIMLFPYLALAYNPVNKTTVAEDLERMAVWEGQVWRHRAPTNKHIDRVMDKVGGWLLIGGCRWVGGAAVGVIWWDVCRTGQVDIWLRYPIDW